MQDILQFFDHLTNPQKLVWVFICLGFGLALEFMFPLFKFKYHKWKHAGVNLVFLTTTLLINALFGVLTVGIFVWTERQGIGLLRMVDWPVLVELILGVMFLDLLAQYVVHYLLHKIKWMWKLHMVHHSDTHVDVTTGTRHHPLDFVTRESFALLAIIIGGMPFSYYMIYRILSVFFTYFTHANFVLPSWLDKTISLIFISPNMHKFHHHFERPWTDTNFGNMFSIWDRLFGTLVYADPQKIKYGLDVLEGKPDENVMYQLKVPFDSSIKTDY